MLRVHSVLLSACLGLVFSLSSALPAEADVLAATPTSSMSAVMAGERFYLSGPIGSGSTTRIVYLQRYDSGRWLNVPSSQTPTNPLTTTTGSYRFSVRISQTTRFRITSPRAGSEDREYSKSLVVPVVRQGVAAWITRTCSGNRCGNQAVAEGYVRPVRENRQVILQVLSGSTWRMVGWRRTDAAGRFAVPFSIAGWSQWKPRSFRILAGKYMLAPSAPSSRMSFMPGPTTLGRNVLRVDVNGGAFPSRKGADYRGFATFSRDGIVQFKRASLDKFGVRGSTTAGYPKKPYNLRFAAVPPAKMDGMGKDRRWTLLAMYADQSFVREKTALDLGRRLTNLSHGTAGRGMTWNPESRYVELFLNSEYKGAYLLTEKVHIDGDKVDVGDNTGMIMEADMDEISDSRKGFRASRSGTIFAFKEPDTLGAPAGITPTKLSAIRSKVAAVESYLYGSRRSSYRTHIDRESAADFHLAQEFIKDTDADFWRSKYFTWDMARTCGNQLCNGQLHFGPLWDFDKSIGNIDPTNPATAFIRSYRGWHANGTGVPKAHHTTYRTHWFAQLWKDPGFRGYLRYRWKQARPVFYQTWSSEVAKNRNLIGIGAYNDRKRWAGASKLYKPKSSTYNGEVNYVASWLKQRYLWMNSQLG